MNAFHDLKSLGLSAEQRSKRTACLGGSDANIILGGDKDKILRLWQEKRGEVEPEDLSDVLPVQMGSFTEPFNLAWFQKQTGLTITRYQEEVSTAEHKGIPMTCTLDGYVKERDAIIDAKHVNPFGSEDDVLNKYMPQLHHNMIVCGVQLSVLSVFFGNHKWVPMWVEYDPIYASFLLDAEESFWRCVQTGEEPVAVEVAAPKPSEYREYDLGTNNAWVSHAADWLDKKEAADAFTKAQKELKDLVPDDASVCFGAGVQAKRDKRGALRFSEMKNGK